MLILMLPAHAHNRSNPSYKLTHAHTHMYTYTNVFLLHTLPPSPPLSSSILVKMDSWARLGEVWRADVDDKIAVVTRQMK